MNQPVLQVRELSVSYGGVKAVQGVSLEVNAGQILGLIGPNGAGKTSLIDAITGFATYSGSVLVNGLSLDTLPAHLRTRSGVARTFQHAELFEDLDTLGNIAIAQGRMKWTDALRDMIKPNGAAFRAESMALLERFGLAEFAHHRPSELSQGQRKLVGVARALASGPAVIVMDEPAAGLDTNETAELADRLTALRATGMAVLLVDHDITLISGVCDQICVLDFGKVIGHGTPAEIQTNRRVMDAYLGPSAESEI